MYEGNMGGLRMRGLLISVAVVWISGCGSERTIRPPPNKTTTDGMLATDDDAGPLGVTRDASTSPDASFEGDGEAGVPSIVPPGDASAGWRDTGAAIQDENLCPNAPGCADATVPEPLQVNGYATQLYNPGISLDANGNGLAVWAQLIDDEVFEYRVSANRFDPVAGWGEAETLVTSTDSYTVGTCVRGNARGDAVVSWVVSPFDMDKPRDYFVWASTYSIASGWSPPTAVSSASVVVGVAECAIDGDGNALVAWSEYDGNDENLFANRYSVMAGWGSPEGFEESGNTVDVALAMNAGGDGIVVWTNGSSSVRASYFSSTTGWQKPEVISGVSGLEIVEADVAMNVNGDAVATWSEHSRNEHQVWSNRLTMVQGWGKPERMDDGSEIASNPRIGIDSSGAALAVWEGYVEPNVRIRARRAAAGGGWDTSKLLSSDGSQLTLAVNASGQAIAAWRDHYDYAIQGKIAVGYYTPGTGWEATTRVVSTLGAESGFPSVAISDNGQAAVVWLQDRHGEPRAVMSNHRL